MRRPSPAPPDGRVRRGHVTAFFSKSRLRFVFFQCISNGQCCIQCTLRWGIECQEEKGIANRKCLAISGVICRDGAAHYHPSRSPMATGNCRTAVIVLALLDSVIAYRRAAAGAAIVDGLRIESARRAVLLTRSEAIGPLTAFTTSKALTKPVIPHLRGRQITDGVSLSISQDLLDRHCEKHKESYCYM